MKFKVTYVVSCELLCETEIDATDEVTARIKFKDGDYTRDDTEDDLVQWDTSEIQEIKKISDEPTEPSRLKWDGPDMMEGF